MILGISASGRPAYRNETGYFFCGATEELVKYLLAETELETEYISLNDNVIRGCIGCVECASDNICVLKDDWAAIRDKMFEAEAVVFGAPNYFGAINALGHAFLERTFSLRHRERFPLAGKLNAIVTVGSGQPGPVEEYIRKMFRSNYMAEPIGVLRSSGISQCYRCGYGEKCAAGSVVNKYGFLDEIKDHHRPVLPKDSYKSAEIIAHRLSEIIKTKRKK